MIKIILFDIDNTLLSFDDFVKNTIKKGFKEFSLGEYKNEMFHVFNKINTKLWNKIENSELDLEKLKKIRWNMIFKDLGIKGDGEVFEKYFRDNLFESAIHVDGASDLLKYLYSKYILCVSSNGPYLQQINRLKKAGMLEYFTDVFISEEIGASKPSEKFFNTCLNRISLKLNKAVSPNEVMIIGDSLSSDILGGINSGMKTCFYNPDRKIIPKEISIDYQVSSLLDIKNIL